MSTDANEETRRAYEEAGVSEPDLSYIDEYLASPDEVPTWSQGWVREDAEAVEAAADSGQWVYFWKMVHSPMFFGGPGTNCYYRDVASGRRCTIYRYQERQFGRQMTGYSCGGGNPIWQIKVRVWTGNP